MVTIIMQHEVKDFSDWKTFFDADEPNRAEAGIKLHGLYTSVKNPNDVTMIFEAPDAEVLDTYTGNPKVQEIMQKAGVISIPEASVLHKV